MPSVVQHRRGPDGLPIGSRQSILAPDVAAAEAVLCNPGSVQKSVAFSFPFVPEEKCRALFQTGSQTNMEERLFPTNPAMNEFLSGINRSFGSSFDVLQITKGTPSGSLKTFCSTGILTCKEPLARIAAIVLVQPERVSDCSIVLKTKGDGRSVPAQDGESGAERTLVNEDKRTWRFKMPPNKVLMLTGSGAKTLRLKTCFSEGGDPPFVVTLFKTRACRRRVTFGKNTVVEIPRVVDEAVTDSEHDYAGALDLSPKKYEPHTPASFKDEVAQSVGTRGMHALATDIMGLHTKATGLPAGSIPKKRRLNF